MSTPKESSDKEVLRNLAATLERLTNQNNQIPIESIPMFHGKISAYQTELYIIKMEEYFQDKGIEEDYDKVNTFRSRLTGIASIWFKDVINNDKFIEFDDLITQFKNRFYPPGGLETIKNEYIHLTQQRSVEEYSCRFQELQTRLPTIFRTKEDFVADYIRGLKPNNRMHVKARGPPTLNEAIVLALESESIQKELNYTRNNRGYQMGQSNGFRAPHQFNNFRRSDTNHPPRNHFDKYADNANHYVPQNIRNFRSSDPDAMDIDHIDARRNSRTCYSCGKPGHFARNCQSKNGHGQH
jgi:hypothetical protein